MVTERRGEETCGTAVVPFANLNSQTGDFFSDGLTEETIAHLGRSCKNVAVIAPMSSLHLKHNSLNLIRVARQLHADLVLSGTVSRMDGCLRVTARLVRSRDQICVWTKSYLREDDNYFAAQEEISDNISREVLPALADPDASLLDNHGRSSSQPPGIPTSNG
jgi:TolB-like protein